MKPVLMTIIAFVVAANATAYPMFCKGNGYVVSVNATSSLAQVYEKLNQPAMFGKLKCATIFPLINRAVGTPVITCSTIQHVADAGFLMQVIKQPRTNRLIGTLKTRTIAGPILLANLTCVMAE